MMKVTSQKIQYIQETVLSDINIMVSFINVIKLEFSRYLLLEEKEVKEIFSNTSLADERVNKEISNYKNNIFKKNNTSLLFIKTFFKENKDTIVKMNNIFGHYNDNVDKEKLIIFVENIFKQYKNDFNVNKVIELKDKVNERSYIFLSNCFIACSIIHSILKTNEEEQTLNDFLKEEEINLIDSFNKKMNDLLDEVKNQLYFEQVKVKEPLSKKKLIDNCMALSLKLEGKKVNSKNIKEFSSYLNDLNKMSYIKLEEEFEWLEKLVLEKNNKKRK